MNVGVIGAGSLGTALAQTIAQNVDEVILHLRRQSLADDINGTGFNSEYYPNVKLLDNISATCDLNDLKSCKIIFLSIPSSAFRTILDDLRSVVSKDTILVTTAKGIEYPSLKTMGNIIEEYFDDNYVALSGPNFASEIVLNLPTVSNIASRNKKNAETVKEVLSTNQFKVKIIDDVVGLEICGIIKNINAIANGICEGMKVNEKGNAATASEYCGFGDLVLTSTSFESRNHTLGMLYGQRLIVDEKASGIVFEGKNSIMAIKDICDNNGIESVIVDFVHDVIVGHALPKIAFRKLWAGIE